MSMRHPMSIKMSFTFDQNCFWPFKCQPHKMVKHTQTIHREFADNDKMDL